jgi:hypothetical protein
MVVIIFPDGRGQKICEERVLAHRISIYKILEALVANCLRVSVILLFCSYNYFLSKRVATE